MTVTIRRTFAEAVEILFSAWLEGRELVGVRDTDARGVLWVSGASISVNLAAPTIVDVRAKWQIMTAKEASVVVQAVNQSLAGVPNKGPAS